MTGKCTGTWPTGAVWKDEENCEVGLVAKGPKGPREGEKFSIFISLEGDNVV